MRVYPTLTRPPNQIVHPTGHSHPLRRTALIGARSSGVTQILDIPTGELDLHPLAVITPVRLGHMRVDVNSTSIVSGSSITRGPLSSAPYHVTLVHGCVVCIRREYTMSDCP